MLKAVYHDGRNRHSIDARYLFRQLTVGERVEVIYESGTPSRGAVYTFWGYWLGWKELLYSVVGYAVLFLVAIAITNNPTPEAVMEQLDNTEEKKRKYLD